MSDFCVINQRPPRTLRLGDFARKGGNINYQNLPPSSFSSLLQFFQFLRIIHLLCCACCMYYEHKRSLSTLTKEQTFTRETEYRRLLYLQERNSCLFQFILFLCLHFFVFDQNSLQLHMQNIIQILSIVNSMISFFFHNPESHTSWFIPCYY